MLLSPEGGKKKRRRERRERATGRRRRKEENKKSQKEEMRGGRGTKGEDGAGAGRREAERSSWLPLVTLCW